MVLGGFPMVSRSRLKNLGALGTSIGIIKGISEIERWFVKLAQFGVDPTNEDVERGCSAEERNPD